ncbi:MAG: arsenate reductase (glutaredoxin) [Salaquimonas sp.]|jgi:arsenate reductase|nr:arsenate reductase (glutaredoxin) [Salaquimonas sp.]
MDITIWHNPRCSKSRQTLELLRNRGVEPRVIEYLKNPPSRAEIKRVLGLLGITAHDLLRRGEAAYKERGLSKKTDEADIIEAMIHDPVLIERPVVITEDRAIIGRPPEAVLEIV